MPRQVLVAWFVSRLGLIAMVWAVAALAGIPAERHPWRDGNWLLDRLAYWDSYHFIRIAVDGYFSPDRRCCDQAFFPGYPLLLRALAPLGGGSEVLAGVVVSVLASTVAAWALWHLAWREAADARAARRAVLVFALAPFSVFTVAVYTESLWLAAALLAWLAASRRQWWLAALPAALAVGTRVNGMFLLVGLGVLYLTQLAHDRSWRPRWDVLSFAVALAPLGAYVFWLHGHTGSWTAFSDAQGIGWGREAVWPWQTYAVMWHGIGAAPSGWLATSRLIDVAAVTGGVALCVVVARQARWAELAYLVPSVLVLLTSPFYTSAGRYALAWFPLYLVLARAGQASRWRPLVTALTVTSGLLAAVVLVFFATRAWIG